MDKERESERTKNELITNVAHDLRTPLTSIIGYLELLSGPVVLPPEMQKKYPAVGTASPPPDGGISQNPVAGSGSAQIPRVFFNFPCLQLTFSIFHGILNYRK